MKIVICTSEKEFVEHGAYLLGEAVVTNDPTNLLLAGGHTPLPIYACFVTKALNLSHTHIFQTDERITDKPEEQNRTTMEKALTRGEALQYHWMDTTNPSAYADLLADRTFHLAMIGIGPDGHIASVFPETMRSLPDATVFYSQTQEYSPHERMTIHPNIILEAKKLVVVLRGAEDAEILERLQKEKVDGTKPMDLLRAHDDCTVLYVSDAANH